ncbi:beta-galactoside alpha-2,6-sialyltransferase 2-like isoform X2 [Ptychodera flava]|uniref:beta-galactoside alpha-2,6-sialyltransferase 2-like isoform X2 n=1 Tax=Ptychodera flava TaxID=63121 RepID=UPI00396A9338
MKRATLLFLVMLFSVLSMTFFMFLTRGIQFREPNVFTDKCFTLTDFQVALESGFFSADKATQLARDAKQLLSSNDTGVIGGNFTKREYNTNLYKAYSLKIDPIRSRVHLVRCEKDKFSNKKLTNLVRVLTVKGQASQRTGAKVSADLLSSVQVILPDVKNSTVRHILLSYDKQFREGQQSSKGCRAGNRRSFKRFKGPIKPNDVLCRIRQANSMQVLTRASSPFKELGIAEYFPEKTIEESLHFNTCAVVFSSSSLKYTALGKEIDNHDAVLRFNDAPTAGFERDVGSKTTIRLINSNAFQKLSQQNYRHFKNVTLVIWRSGPLNDSMYTWYSEKPGINLFSKYIAWKTLFPDQDVVLLHPLTLWRELDTLVYFTEGRVRCRPPSSGFTGAVLMLRICEKIDIYGYERHLSRSECHYYDSTTCTETPWHPLGPEKDLMGAAHTGTMEAMDRGRVTLNGIETVKGKCS